MIVSTKIGHRGNYVSMLGQVASGINNIYCVRVASPVSNIEVKNDKGISLVECRIMGKRLGGKRSADDPAYNPLAPGDWVNISLDSDKSGRGWILDRKARTSAIRRWNRKRHAPQTIAANIDVLMAVGSASSPPFRPRFLDRLLLCAELGGAKPVVVINKVDLGISASVNSRLSVYRAMGYHVVVCSAKTGQGLAEFLEIMEEAELPALVGHSGVGKSALLNRADPNLHRVEGELSRKYDRGSHTTRYGEIVSVAGKTIAIDTPGIREMEIADIEPRELRLWYQDFLPFVENCAFPGCLCVNEVGCAVRAATARGDIAQDRYTGYVNILKELQTAFAQRR